ncbi:concanavalin A-like lectin/glucanase domain-containing protein [Cunninghamella echinulata]|nr:concanavalin A-like lectin/glucanase domain-containing protein [Cunninghamella echinulata]
MLSLIHLMDSNYTWIFIVGIVVFFFVIIVLLCFTKATGERLFLGGTDDPELAAEIVETPALLALLSEDARLSYERAKIFQQRFPPDSIQTDITLSQYVTIQEKGVSAFEFDWDMETNTMVSARTELQFFHGECSLQTNLPLPRNQDVYYWEAKMYEKPRSTIVSIGVATKPYPNWRLPGWNRHSVGYFSNTGNKHFNNPFHGKYYGSSFQEGDVIGVGYRPRSGTIFYTKNGRKLEDACTNLRWNLFPTIGANGPCQIHVNLGQRGFVFVEANVKKWGLAPMQGTLAPPPAYGYESESLLLERGSSLPRSDYYQQSLTQSHRSIRSNLSEEGRERQEESEEDDDDEQPLIQLHMPIPRSTSAAPRYHHFHQYQQQHIQRPRFPSHSPPSYSTLPRTSMINNYGSNDTTTLLINQNNNNNNNNSNNDP